MFGCSPVPQNRVFRRPHRVRESVGPVPSATWTEAADSLPPTRALDTCHDAPEGRDDAGPVHGQAPGPPSRHCRALARRAVVAVMDRLLADRACVARRSSSCCSRLSCSSCPRSVRLAGAASSQGQASARRPDRRDGKPRRPGLAGRLGRRRHLLVVAFLKRTNLWTCARSARQMEARARPGAMASPGCTRGRPRRWQRSSACRRR